MKRSVYLTLAVGLLAGLVPSTPSQAGSIFRTTVTVTNNTGMALDEIRTTWTGTGESISNVAVSAGPGAPTTSIGNTIEIPFANPLPNGGTITFSFETASDPLTLAGGTWLFTTSTGTTFMTTVDPVRDQLTFSTAVVVGAASVPEPASVFLLGIGMAGFLASRRFVKRAEVV